MTEADWLECSDAVTLLEWIAPRVSKRKLQLYVCGGCKHIQHLFFHPGSMEAVEVGSRVADGLVDDTEWDQASYNSESPTFGYSFQEEFWQTYPGDPNHQLPKLVPLGALSHSVLTGGKWEVNEAVRDRLLAAAELAYSCLRGWLCGGLMRRVDWPGRWMVDCVFGNPFRSADLGKYSTEDVIFRIADRIYETGHFDAMEELERALTSAGCRDAAALTHCRAERHVRGCWVIDQLLGRK